MKPINITIALMLFISTKSFAFFENNKVTCQKETGCSLSHVISDYRKELSKKDIDYTFIGKEKSPKIEIRKYKMTSQSWSPNDMVTPEKWLHDVDIYIPESPKTQRALVVVNNGVNHDNGSQKSRGPTDFSEEVLTTIARTTHTIVISVSNIPNQYLTYQHDDKPLKEDDSVARSWVLFMDDPEQRKLMSLHIPMSTSVSQAMRMAKKELTQWDINGFIVTGASKRGWTTWLTAISDPDVEAIVPFVIDLLDTDVALENMYRSYGGNWPVAFYPYYEKGIDKRVKTPNFSKLLEIEDPLRYINSIYQQRLAIPKYIVNASGDDFYVPDNTKFYYGKLPGDKSLRIVPNTDHHGILKFTEQSLISFLNRFQNKKVLPQVDSLIKNNVLSVVFSEKPVKIIRWTAINAEARDFRYACGIRYTPSPITISPRNKIDIPLDYPSTGWVATYIEATFNDGYVATTQVYITPDEKYVNTPPPSGGPACQTLPGRGLGENIQ
ncbi:PhoPQ-activated pathogenicity-related family protein [Pectobacterium brasiliense]|uniref:PhoPQ-activated pathogenicity-related family protein n=1 Tax=Pectobacterium brasiliense TaxID=180957 RepID=UPI00196908C6|nr:PhoPQ-activated pathogenicity-related family protein [Pectobacterium brasiliense]MBN3265242.1 PhoPQ-regulated protein [Pectobacterium brasiliense]